MIDLLEKIKGNSIAAPKKVTRKAHHPMFTVSTIKILRCIISDQGLNSKEIQKSTGISFNHISHTLMKFCEADIMLRTRGSIRDKAYRYRLLITNEAAIALAAKEELKINTPNFSGRIKQIFEIITKAHSCTAKFIADIIGVCNQNARVYITKLVNMGMITQVPSKVKGIQFEYIVKVAA